MKNSPTFSLSRTSVRKWARSWGDITVDEGRLQIFVTLSFERGGLFSFCLHLVWMLYPQEAGKMWCQPRAKTSPIPSSFWFYILESSEFRVKSSLPWRRKYMKHHTESPLDNMEKRLPVSSCPHQDADRVREPPWTSIIPRKLPHDCSLSRCHMEQNCLTYPTHPQSQGRKQNGGYSTGRTWWWAGWRGVELCSKR